MADRILTVNVGASKFLLAEFAVKSGKSPQLLNYGAGALGNNPDQEGGIAPDLGMQMRAVMRERGIRPAPLMISLSGQMVFPRFVKLPAVSEDKLQQMVQYEVEQNVPFPLDEIVWNYQFLGDASSGEQAAMIVAAKVDSVREVTDSVTAAKLEPDLVDVAPMALYNCLKYNYPDLDGCTVLLDIGARSTNLIFVEDEKIYSRCIPVAGNAITSEIAKVFEISFEEAERLKAERAFVSLGGVYQAEDEIDEKISKIVRNVVTRLHAEISRSINFYRSQQGGSVPTRIILTGGSAVIPQLDYFFREKLQVEVEVLNPFNNLHISPRLNPKALEHDGFEMAECVGLALRRSMKCPVEINLMPPEITEQKSFQKRIPYLTLAAAGILCGLGLWIIYEKQISKNLDEQLEVAEQKYTKMNADAKRYDAAFSQQKEKVEDADAAIARMSIRSRWLDRIQKVQQAVSDFTGVWIMSLTPIAPTSATEDSEGAPAASGGESSKGVRIVLRGWNDRLREIEAKNNRGTVAEQLCSKLKTFAAFGKAESDVSIVGSKDVDGYMTEFTIDAIFASASSESKEKEDE